MSGSSPEIERLIQLLAKLPGLGPRSARRAALQLFQKRESVMIPLAHALEEASSHIKTCKTCYNLDTTDPCTICTDPRRNSSLICVVETVGDLWALERAGAFRGRYHVLGGVLSALDGIGPDDLNLPSLISRSNEPEVTEIILALNATIDGQTTAHVIADKLVGANVNITSLARGVPVGGELDYLDDGTLSAAFKSRRPA